MVVLSIDSKMSSWRIFEVLFIWTLNPRHNRQPLPVCYFLKGQRNRSKTSMMLLNDINIIVCMVHSKIGLEHVEVVSVYD